jgi:hypothetical protein
MSKEIVPLHIDFTNTNQLNESFLEMFGSTVKLILQRMFGQDVFLPPVSVTGDRYQVESFARVLAGERRYFDSYVKYGLNDPRTYRNKYELQSAVSNFERATGIKWPFK